MKFYFPALAAVLMVSSCQKKSDVKENTHGKAPDVTAAAPGYAGRQCFLKVSEGRDGATIIRDSIMFDMQRSGDSIMGSLNWVPQEKDKKMSLYKGVIKGTAGTVIASAMAEGMNYKEEVIFTLTDSTVAIKYGEMVQDKNGIWRYKDTAAASEQVLKKINCK